MAVLSGAPSIWSRNVQSVDNGLWIYDIQYGDAWDEHMPRHPRVFLSKARGTVYMAPALLRYNDYYAIQQVYSVAFHIQISTQGTFTQTMFSTNGAMREAAGFVPAVPSVLPPFARSSTTTPRGTVAGRTYGAASEDGANYVALFTETTTYALWLALSGGTVRSWTSLGINDFSVTAIMGDAYDNRGVFYPRVDPFAYFVSATEIRIIHKQTDVWANPTTPNVYMSVWNGTSITSTTLMLDVPALDYEVVRKDGFLFFMYIRPDVPGTYYLRRWNESTNAWAGTAIATTAPRVPDVSNWRPGGRQAKNDVFTYKGFEYIVHSWPEQMLVYRYPIGSPASVAVFRSSRVPLSLGDPYYADTDYVEEYDKHIRNAGAMTGIEYDPESDTAYVVTMQALTVHPSTPGSITGTGPIVDSSTFRVRMYSFPLDSATAPTTGVWLNETVDYVKAHGTIQWLRPEFICYLPSRHGAEQHGALLLHAVRADRSTNGTFLHVLRIRLWTTPYTHELEPEPITYDEPVSASLVAQKDLDASAPIDYSAIASVRRPRLAAWGADWGGAQVSYEFVESHFVLFTELTADVTTVSVVNIEAPFLLDTTVSVTLDSFTVAFVSFDWLSMGVTFLEDFLDLVNEERLAAYGRHPIELVGTTETSLRYLLDYDPAQSHSDNMAATRTQEHDHPDFPIGEQTFTERISRMVSDDGAAAENLIGYTGLFTRGASLPTAQNLFDDWKSSPTHYANMMSDFVAQSAPHYAGFVFSLLAFREGRAEMYLSGQDLPPEYMTLYFTNVFATIKETTLETTLMFNWESHELQALLLSYSWDSFAMVNVKAAHEAVHSLRVAAAHDADAGVNIAAAHHMDTVVGVSAHHVALHTNSAGRATQASTSRYELQPFSVARAHEAYWSRSVAQQHNAQWEDFPRLTVAHIAPYDNQPAVAAAHIALYGQPTPIHAVHVAPLHAQQRVTQGHEVRPVMGANVLVSHETAMAILASDPVRASLTSLYTMAQDAAPMHVASVMDVTLHGRTIPVEDGYISAQFDDPGFKASFRVDDIDFVANAKLCDPIEIDFNGTKYTMFISNIRTTMSEDATVQQDVVEAQSPVFLLGESFSTNTTYAPDDAKLLSDILEELLGMPVDFSQHIDWVIPYGRAQASDQAPLRIAQDLLNPASRLLSRPDGSLYVIPRYPYALNTLEQQAVDVEASDETNVFSRSSVHAHAHGFNRYRVRDGDASFEDVIEYDEETGIVSVWVSPYRTSWRLASTTEHGVLLDALGEEVMEHEKRIEVQAGTASVDYPILDIVSVEWLTKSLQGLSAEPYSSRITAPVSVNFGYAVANIKYRSRVSRFRLSTSTPIEVTQLIIVEG